jgi:hypothetical protein
MTELVSWRPSAGRRLTQSRVDFQSEQRTRFMLLGETMIRHALPSGAIAAISLGVHGATAGSCLIASPRFPLRVTAGVLSAGSDAVDLASIAPPADKNLTAAASTQKHPARSFIGTCGSAGPTRGVPALCVCLFQQYSALRPLVYCFSGIRKNTIPSSH